MDFIKKNFLLILIFFLGLYLRVNYDTFLSGYNFDEVAIVSIAKQSFPFEILFKLAKLDYHAPLYYLLIHPFTHLSHEWLYLRFFNVFLSLVNIFVFYKIGSILKDKNFGLILALFFSVWHIQISIANFVKFYCLCFLLCSIVIYYFIDILKNNKNHILFGIFCALFALSSTFGFVFVFFGYFILFLKNKNKALLKSFLIALVGFLGYLPILFVQAKISFSALISPHGNYPDLSLFSFYSFLNDYFSPLLNYSCNVETVEANPLIIKAIKAIIFEKTIDYLNFISFAVFSLMPVMVGIFGITFSLKNKYSRNILYLALLFLASSLVLIKLEIFGFIPLYLYPSGLIIVICALYGLCCENKFFKILIFLLISLQLLITNVYPPLKRDNNNKIYCNTEQFFNEIDDKTPVILIDAGRFLKEYYKNKNIFALDYEELGLSHSRKYYDLIFKKYINSKVDKYNLKEKIEPVILNDLKSEEFEKYLFDNLISKLKKGDKIIFAFNSDGSPFIYSDDEIKKYLLLPYHPNLANSSLKFQLFDDYNNYLDIGLLSEIIQSYSNKLVIEIIEKYFKRIELKQYIRTSANTYLYNEKSLNYTDSTIDIARSNPLGWIFTTYEKR